MSCQYCGAPIERSTTTSTTCPFCNRVNEPLPTRVEVPVPVEIVQNVVQVTSANAASAPHELRCPRCRKRLFTATVKDVELSACAGCGGIWVANASARRVLSQPEDIFAEMATRAGNNATARATRAEERICPECPAVLDQTRTHGVELDLCEEHGTWFDAFELATLVRILRGEETAASPARTVQCARCHQPIAADHANVTDMGLQCDVCWRKEQTSEIAAFDQKIQQEGGAFAVAGVMLGIAGAILGASSD
ncbi:MAG TPA: zf-TFIIB domain-containing protein [Polyangiaceae bacterium]|nr:zf-TFIIB domain-containing protein [Polyangiaceae bacterium]